MAITDEAAALVEFHRGEVVSGDAQGQHVKAICALRQSDTSGKQGAPNAAALRVTGDHHPDNVADVPLLDAALPFTTDGANQPRAAPRTEREVAARWLCVGESSQVALGAAEVLFVGV